MKAAAPKTIDYRTWKAEATKLLARHGISAGAIPEKERRRLFVELQTTPADAQGVRASVMRHRASSWWARSPTSFGSGT